MTLPLMFDIFGWMNVMKVIYRKIAIHPSPMFTFLRVHRLTKVNL